MSKDVMELLFGSKLRVKMLKFLFRNAGLSFNTKEVAHRLREKWPKVNREIKTLLEMNLLRTKR